MANEQNLIPFDERTESEQRAIRSKGGKVSGESRRRKRATREILEIYMSMPLKDGKKADIEGVKNFMEMGGKNMTVEEAINAKIVSKALKGDLNAYNMVLALLGEKPADKMQVEAKVNPMSELTTEELRKLIESHETND